MCFFCMLRRQPRSTRTDPLFPSTTRHRYRSPSLDRFGLRLAKKAASPSGPSALARRSAIFCAVNSISASSTTACATRATSRLLSRMAPGAPCSRAATTSRPRVASAPSSATVSCTSPMRQASARSEEHTSELQSLMRNSYAVFCLKKKKNKTHTDEYRNELKISKQTKTIHIYKKDEITNKYNQ